VAASLAEYSQDTLLSLTEKHSKKRTQVPVSHFRNILVHVGVLNETAD